MVFKNFRVNAGLRILLLIVTIFLLLFTLMNKHILTTVLLGVFTVYQIFSLYQFVDKTNRHLASFLESIRFSEFTRSFNVEGMGSSFDQLNKAFNDVIQDFQAIRSEKEEHFHYLQNVVQNTDVSIIAYLKDGTVDMINKAAKKLFQISDLKNIKGLEHLSTELVQTLLDLKPGHHYLIKVQDEDDLLQLAIFGTEIKLKNKFITLVTLKNIQNVLEDQETEAWQKLIRVLTHEIMNSITPIASISSTLDIMLKDIRAKEKKDNECEMDKDTVIELHKALQTINKRSIGLLHFVNTYRNLTRIPNPNFNITNARNIFENIIHLMEDEIKKSGINIEIRIEPEDLQVSADEELIVQVLINLVKNSIHALEKTSDGKIILKSFFNKRGRPTMQVIDNGPGILPDVLDKVFIPFFTTNPKGSGIGLSLSRQILRLHGGTITAYSRPDIETVFSLTF